MAADTRYQAAFLLYKLSGLDDWKFSLDSDVLDLTVPGGISIDFRFEDIIKYEYQGEGDWHLIIEFTANEDLYEYSLFAFAYGRGYHHDDIEWEDIEDLDSLERKKL